MPTIGHDDFSTGQLITVLEINTEWRKFVADAIGVYFEIAMRKATESDENDVLPKLALLVDDFYDSLNTPP